MSSDNIDLEKLQKQIEYYFSDENLKRDQFFHRIISSTETGFVPLQVLLKCNRIIKLNASIDDIKNCIEKSSLLELSASSDKLRRKNNSAIPHLSQNKFYIVLENDEVPENKNPFRAKIYSFTTVGHLGNAPEVRRALSKALGFNIPFLRTGKNSGEFICEINQKVESGKIIAGKWRLLIQPLAPEESKNWLNHHRIVAEKSIENTLNKNQNFSQGVWELGGRTFKSLEALRDYIKLLINRTPDGAKLPIEESNFVKEILKFHEDSTKAQTKGDIVVDKHPDFPSTRCFFILNADGKKIDFSFHKCLSKIPFKNINIMDDN